MRPGEGKDAQERDELKARTSVIVKWTPSVVLQSTCSRVHNFLGTLFIRIYSNQRPEAHAAVFEWLYCSRRADRQGESDGDTNRELRLGRVAELSSENVVVDVKLLVVAVE